MDSYTKYAEDFWSEYPSAVLQHVTPEDIAEVKLNFALLASQYERADSFRILPLSRKKEFDELASKGCCGSFTTQIKCKSGRIYWAGFNWGH